MGADYHYWCCGEWFQESVDDYMRQPCPKCGTRVDPAAVEGIPWSGKEFVPHRDFTSGVVVKSRKELKAAHEALGVVQMDKRDWVRTIKEPALHECWKQEQGLPAFEAPIKMPSVAEVADGLERARSRLKYDESYRKRFDPKHPEFAVTNKGPEG